VLFDPLGADVAPDAAALARLGEMEISLLPCHPAEAWLERLTVERLGRSLVPLLGALASAEAPPRPDTGWALPGPIEAMLALRGRGERSEVDRTTVVLRHSFPIITGGELGLREGIDVVENGGTALRDGADPITGAVRQGVFDTRLESLVLPLEAQESVFSVPTVVVNTGARVLAPGAMVPTDVVPPGLAQAAESRLRAGCWVVLPAGAPTGFWAVDPQTGATLGYGGPGWGMAIGDRVILARSVWLNVLGGIACTILSAHGPLGTLPFELVLCWFGTLLGVWKAKAAFHGIEMMAAHFALDLKGVAILWTLLKAFDLYVVSGPD
jgi:hypothetical protein